MREAGLYTNLITSAIGLSERRLNELDEAGLNGCDLLLANEFFYHICLIRIRIDPFPHLPASPHFAGSGFHLSVQFVFVFEVIARTVDIGWRGSVFYPWPWFAFATYEHRRIPMRCPLYLPGSYQVRYLCWDEPCVPSLGPPCHHCGSHCSVVTAR